VGCTLTGFWREAHTKVQAFELWLVRALTGFWREAHTKVQALRALVSARANRFWREAHTKVQALRALVSARANRCLAGSTYQRAAQTKGRGQMEGITNQRQRCQMEGITNQRQRCQIEGVTNQRWVFIWDCMHKPKAERPGARRQRCHFTLTKGREARCRVPH